MFIISLKNILRGKSVLFALLLLFILGLTSIIIGKQFLQKQQKAIEQTTVFQQQQIDRNVLYFDKEMGLLLYYLKFSNVNKTEPITGLSIGQRDTESSIKSLTIRGLEAQLYDADLNNPTNLLSGNLDLGFVIIFLFPLFIISLCYGIYSEEKELKTLQLLVVQSSKNYFFVFLKLCSRMVLVFAILLLLFISASIILKLPWNLPFVSFIMASILYLLFWFSICFFVISFKKSSSNNAITLLSIWLTLTIVLPAILNNYVSNKYPIPEALSTMVKQRDGYHKKWDLDKEPTLEKFYEIYPQFRKYKLSDKTFSWLWYYAMQHMGDYESSDDAKKMRQKIINRQDFSQTIGKFIPTIHTQLLFNDLAGSGIQNQFNYLDNTKLFHEKMRLHFYPKIFNEDDVKKQDWKKYKIVFYSEKPTVNWLNSFFPLLFSSVLVLILGFLTFKSSKEI